MSSQNITKVVLDFDGTCTQIPVIYEGYLETYRLKFNELVGPLAKQEWADAQYIVKENSPKAGWMLAGTPAAPGGADPYILADESAKFILRRRQKPITLPAEINAHSYATNPAPWRQEAKEVLIYLESLLAKNSSFNRAISSLMTSWEDGLAGEVVTSLISPYISKGFFFFLPHFV